LIAVGVSGAVQFVSGMEKSDRIIAINSDPQADILKVAHVGVVGDAYEILPQWIEALKKGEFHV